MSRERWLPCKQAASLPVAPEICVEILSPRNRREEMRQKMALYYQAGAEEVWLCDEDGRMEFFVKSSPIPVLQSRFCLTFPQRIDIDD